VLSTNSAIVALLVAACRTAGSGVSLGSGTCDGRSSRSEQPEAMASTRTAVHTTTSQGPRLCFRVRLPLGGCSQRSSSSSWDFQTIGLLLQRPGRIS
jgi:hypothetical protein